MFKKLEPTDFPPKVHTLIWDRDCSFCKFWKTRWQQHTGDVVRYTTYQESSSNYKDIPLKEFKKASRLIETDGKIYSGPDSAYRSLYLGGSIFWHNLYQKNSWFRWLSDLAYNHIAKNRAFYYKITVLSFGKDPNRIKHFWLIYVIILTIVIYVFN